MDDLLVAGQSDQLKELTDKLSVNIKIRKVGELRQVGDTVEYLGREVMRVEHGYTLQVNQKLVTMLAKEVNVETSKYTATPSVKYSEAEYAKSPELPREDVTPLGE